MSIRQKKFLWLQCRLAASLGLPRPLSWPPPQTGRLDKWGATRATEHCWTGSLHRPHRSDKYHSRLCHHQISDKVTCIHCKVIFNLVLFLPWLSLTIIPYCPFLKISKQIKNVSWYKKKIILNYEIIRAFIFHTKYYPSSRNF